VFRKITHHQPIGCLSARGLGTPEEGDWVVANIHTFGSSNRPNAPSRPAETQGDM